jgi:hypothetical protein
MSNLALVLNSQNKHEEAEEMNRQTLATRENVLGKQHPYTLMSMSNLAMVLNKQGKHEEAEEMIDRRWRRRRRCLGRSIPRR